jgi:hypothetical protein
MMHRFQHTLYDCSIHRRSVTVKNKDEATHMRRAFSKLKARKEVTIIYPELGGCDFSAIHLCGS